MCLHLLQWSPSKQLDCLLFAMCRSLGLYISVYQSTAILLEPPPVYASLNLKDILAPAWLATFKAMLSLLFQDTHAARRTSCIRCCKA